MLGNLKKKCMERMKTKQHKATLLIKFLYLKNHQLRNYTKNRTEIPTNKTVRLNPNHSEFKEGKHKLNIKKKKRDTHLTNESYISAPKPAETWT